jgi:predicted kinase
VKPDLVQMVCGSTGAGKTTFARERAASLDAVVFSIDEWMMSLFGPDAPEALDPGWIMPRVARCEQQIWTMATQLIRLGTPVILDLGFQRREHRQKYRLLAEAAGTSACLHFVDVDRQERWRRVERRNAQHGDTWHMTITRPMFDYIETIWEPPATSELRPSDSRVTRSA